MRWRIDGLTNDGRRRRLSPSVASGWPGGRRAERRRRRLGVSRPLASIVRRHDQQTDRPTSAHSIDGDDRADVFAQQFTGVTTRDSESESEFS